MNQFLRPRGSLLVLALLASGCAAEAPREETGGATSNISGSFPVGAPYRTTAHVNLRSAPGMDASILRVIPSGETVYSAAGTPREGWYGVTYDGTTGWVSGAYLALEGAATKGISGGAAAPDDVDSSRSAFGQAQMRNVLAYAKSNHSGASRGRCFEYVWRYLVDSGYGLLDDPNDAPDMAPAYARNFAEYMNVDGNAARWHLVRLPITNPYDAPEGSVVVVAAGSPGTRHPTAGDISIAAGSGVFINDGPAMGYGGSHSAFTEGGGKVLGVYAPR